MLRTCVLCVMSATPMISDKQAKEPPLNGQQKQILGAEIGVLKLLCFRHLSESRFLLGALHRRTKCSKFCHYLMQNYFFRIYICTNSFILVNGF